MINCDPEEVGAPPYTLTVPDIYVHDSDLGAVTANTHS